MTIEPNSQELVHVSDLQEYVYCSRRLFYHKFHDEIGRPFELIDGRSKHSRQSSRGGWTKEQYFRSEELGLHGKIDILETGDGVPTPVERKRAESGEFYASDRIQIAAYCMLLEDAIDKPVNIGYVYLYSTDERHPVRVAPELRQEVRRLVTEITSMEPDEPPPLADNPSKCEACSARHYCMPAETAILEPEKAEGTGWEDHA